MPTTSIQKVKLVLLGIFLSFFILESGMRLAGAFLLWKRDSRSAFNPSAREGTYVILCLGESTTMLGGDDAYPYQLEKILNELKPGIHFEIINQGLVGTTTDVIVKNLEYYLDKYQPGMVISMIGINDRGESVEHRGKEGVSIFENWRTYKLAKSIRLRLESRLKGISPGPSRDMPHTKVLNQGEALAQQPAAQSPVDGRSELIKRLDELLVRDIDLQITAKNVNTFIYLALHYISQDQFSKSIKILEEIVEADFKTDMAYFLLGRSYMGTEEFDKAEAMYKNAIKINPSIRSNYTELGDIYIQQERYKEAVEVLQVAIALTGRVEENSKNFMLLGQAYRALKEYGEAEKWLKLAVKANPDYDLARIWLEDLYSAQNKFPETEALLKEAIERDPHNDSLYDRLARRYESRGQDGLAGEYRREAGEMRMHYYKAVTRENYLKIKQMVQERGVQLVSVQYPLRNVEELRRLLDYDRGIIFVDNEKIFHEAVRRDGYNTYFMDKFAGDFGHCSAKGNQLLAQNIANAILKEGFLP